MNTRKQYLLKLLIAQDGPLTGHQLAQKLQVSDRTIRSELKEINDMLYSKDAGATINSLHAQGYILEITDEYKLKKYIKMVINMDNTLPVEPEDRVQHLVNSFLLCSDYLKIEDLADEIYVSRSTIKSDLKDVRIILKNYRLSLSQRPNYGLKLSGNEKQIRYAISDIAFRRIPSSFKYPSHVGWLLSSEHMDIIRDIILRKLKAVQFNLSDIALNNLVVHIAIACQRINHKQYVQLDNIDILNIHNKKEYILATSIIKDIGKKLNIQFPNVEISYVAMHLQGTRLFLNDNKVNIKHNFDEDIFKKVKLMINRVEKQMQLGIIEDQELYIAIALHLKPAIHRYKHHMNVRNPMLEAIKVNYPVAFEAGIIASQALEEFSNIKVDENEIGYIALHFGSAIERAKLKIKPKRCLIVCTTGVGSSQLVLHKLRAKFNNQLSILGTTELHNLCNYNKDAIDFIVSTVPLPENIDIPYVLIDSILDDKEFDKIEKFLGLHSQSIVDQYIDENLIYPHLTFKTPKQIITYLGKELIKKGYAKNGIVETILEREAIAPTSYGNLVAIPHPLVPKSNQTFWTFATLEVPINWSGNQVQFVCLIHIADNDKKNLEPMYNTLINFVDNQNITNKIIEANDTKTILNIIKKM